MELMSEVLGLDQKAERMCLLPLITIQWLTCVPDLCRHLVVLLDAETVTESWKDSISQLCGP